MKRVFANKIFRVVCLNIVDTQPGMRRYRNSICFSFVDPDGKEITGGPEMDRSGTRPRLNAK